MEPTPTAGGILELVRSGATTRGDLQRLTGLSRTAVTARVDSLLSYGLLDEADAAPSTGGRPAAQLRFRPERGLVLAGAIGRSRIQLAVCDLDGVALTERSHDHELDAGPEGGMRFVVRELASMLEELGRPGSDVWGVGLSISGVVDVDRGVSVDSPVLSSWNGVELAPHLRELTSAPVHVDSDSHVLALSERDGHLRRHRNLLVVKASTGFGLGMVVDGRLVRGHRGAAGEIGHVKVEAAEGLACRCGDTGCLEAVAGGWAVVQQLRERGRDVPHLRDVVALARTSDPESKALLRASARHLGAVLADAVTLLNPEAIVLGGDMGDAFDIVAAGVRESLYPRASALATRDLQLLPATHGDRAGLVGCARLALDSVLAPAYVDALVAGQDLVKQE